MHVSEDLLECVKRVGRVQTRTGLMQMHSSDALGVVIAMGLCSTAKMLFDLGDSEIQHWLQCAQSTGYLPVQFKSDSDAQLARLPLDAGLQRLIDRSKSCDPASSDSLMSGMQYIVSQFDDAEELAAMGLEGRHSEADVCLVVPSKATADTQILQ